MPGDLNQRLLAGCVSSLVERGLGLESQVGELDAVEIKLLVSFAEYRLFYRALLQKRPIILVLR